MSVSARLPFELKAKIAALLRLQASDNDGEALNASRAITRLLQRHGASWHDIVDTFFAEPKTAMPDPQPAPNGTTWKRSTGPVDLPRADLLALIDLVEERSPFLPLRSREFLTSLRERAWRPQIHLSERQWRWMQNLIEGI